MKNKVKKYSIIMSVITLVLVSILAIQVNAEEPTTGSITIIAHEQQNGDTTTNPPMEGVEYTIYKVNESCENNNAAETYIEENKVEGISKTTGEDGTVVFDNLELGRYYVSVIAHDGWYNAPDNSINYFYKNFLIDVPTTNLQGDSWDYNIIIEPKYQTAYGNLELTKVDSAGNPIEGVTFKLQYNVEGPHWEDYIPDGSNQVLTVTTDKDGKIRLENLPYGMSIEYRLVEVSAPDGYILSPTLSGLTFEVDENGKISSHNLEDIQDGYYDENSFIGYLFLMLK